MDISEKIFTISEFSNILRRSIEGQFGFIKLQGEISGFKAHSSGHVYFALKDQDSMLDAVIWKTSMTKFLNLNLQDGHSVIVSGKITTYGGRSKYQMIVTDIAFSGYGMMLQKLKELQEKLRIEGLFDIIHKKKIPTFPRYIGIMTSPTGAVFHDMCHRLRHRFPCVTVLFYPVTVQGANAVAEIINGLEILQNQYFDKLDVIIIARGGGSIEDLWSFNDEALLRAVFSCQIPVVSAIGHETDHTLLDEVADLCAPTPTAAAELITPLQADLRIDIFEAIARISRLMNTKYMFYANNSMHVFKTLTNPRHMLNRSWQVFDDYQQRFLGQAQQMMLRYQHLHNNHQILFQKSQNQLMNICLHRRQNVMGLLRQLIQLSMQKMSSYKDKYNYIIDKLQQSSYQEKLNQGFCRLCLDPDGLELVQWDQICEKDKAFLFFDKGSAEITIDRIKIST